MRTFRQVLKSKYRIVVQCCQLVKKCIQADVPEDAAEAEDGFGKLCLLSQLVRAACVS